MRKKNEKKDFSLFLFLLPQLSPPPSLFLTLTTSIPSFGGSFSRCEWSIWPSPPENMMGLIHSRRSPFSPPPAPPPPGTRSPKVLV